MFNLFGCDTLEREMKENERKQLEKEHQEHQEFILRRKWERELEERRKQEEKERKQEERLVRMETDISILKQQLKIIEKIKDV
jgi:hypothetical protein